MLFFPLLLTLFCTSKKKAQNLFSSLKYAAVFDSFRPLIFCSYFHEIETQAEKTRVTDENTDDNQDEDISVDVSNDDSDVESDEEKSGSSDTGDDEEEEENEVSDQEHEQEEEASKAKKTKQPSDVKEGKTLFIRNISFDTSEESLYDLFEQFGEVDYCKMVEDKRTGHSRGMAFVKFKTVEGAEKCLVEADKDGSGKNVV